MIINNEIHNDVKLFVTEKYKITTMFALFGENTLKRPQFFFFLNSKWGSSPVPYNIHPSNQLIYTESSQIKSLNESNSLKIDKFIVYRTLLLYTNNSAHTKLIDYWLPSNQSYMVSMTAVQAREWLLIWQAISMHAYG